MHAYKTGGTAAGLGAASAGHIIVRACTLKGAGDFGTGCGSSPCRNGGLLLSKVTSQDYQIL